MDREFWIQRWERNEIGFHQEEINAHLQEFWPRLELAPNAGVFVPLCGKTRDLLWLRSRGHPVTGVEISRKAVDAFFSENDLQSGHEVAGAFERRAADGLEILVGDFFDLTSNLLPQFAGVYDRASLIALPRKLRHRYVQHLVQLLPSRATILLVTLTYPTEEMEGPPFSVTEEEVRELFQERFRIEPLFDTDILEENPQFRERGLTRLREQAFLLGRI